MTVRIALSCQDIRYIRVLLDRLFEALHLINNEHTSYSINMHISLGLKTINFRVTMHFVLRFQDINQLSEGNALNALSLIPSLSYAKPSSFPSAFLLFPFHAATYAMSPWPDTWIFANQTFWHASHTHTHAYTSVAGITLAITGYQPAATPHTALPAPTLA